MSPDFSSKNYQRGFSLAELLVVMAIMTIMLSVVLVNLPSFQSSTSLQLVAQEVALVIRQAQSYGALTRKAGIDFPSYGVYFAVFNNSNINFYDLRRFRFFADKDKNTYSSDEGQYSGGSQCGNSSNECLEVYKLSGTIRLKAVRACENNTDDSSCRSFGCVGCSLPSENALALNIVFKRPNPEADFWGSIGTGGVALECPINSGSPCNYARITLIAPRTQTCRDIWVSRTGHIYTKANPCPSS